MMFLATMLRNSWLFGVGATTSHCTSRCLRAGAAALLCLCLFAAPAEAKLARELQSASLRQYLQQERLNRRAALHRAAAQATAAARMPKRLRVRSAPAPKIAVPTTTSKRVPREPDENPPDAKPEVRRQGSFITLEGLEMEVLTLVNEEREKKGLGSLRPQSLLQGVAEAYAQDMANRDFFSHKDPEGRASVDRIRASGYLDSPCDCSWSYVTGENLAKGQKTAKQVMQDWMDSPGHRENILHPRFTEIGIAFYDGYWVQNFGTVVINNNGEE